MSATKTMSAPVVAAVPLSITETRIINMVEPEEGGASRSSAVLSTINDVINIETTAALRLDKIRSKGESGVVDKRTVMVPEVGNLPVQTAEWVENASGGNVTLPTTVAFERDANLYKSSLFKQLIHPLDKGMTILYLISLFYLIAALAAFCPTLVVVLVILPLGLVLFQAMKCISTKSGAPSVPLSAQEEFWLSEHEVAQSLVIVSPGLDFATVRRLILDRLVLSETAAGKKLFPRLTQKLVSFRTHHAWVVDSDFDVASQVLDVTAVARVVTETDLLRYVAEMQTKMFSRDRPLWEVHVVCNFGVAQETVLLLRIDACLSDGVALLSLLCKQLSHNSIGYGTKPLYGRSAFVFNVLRSLFVGK